MPKLYTTAALILLLGFAFWYHGERKFNYGELTERTKWQDQVVALTKERDKLRETAEREIVVA